MRREAAVALGFVLFAASLGACAGSTATNTVPPADGVPPPENSAGTGVPAPGSFPRSFLIPGTDTSVSISGFLGATGASRFGQ
jgi:hypothetical protein